MPEAFTNFMNGCAPFWIANSVTSTYLGETNRDRQFEIAKESEDFQKEMERARNITQDQIEAEKIAFQRYMMNMQREYCREERIKQAANLEQQIELPFFIDKWPLELAPDTILKENIRKGKHSLNVILLHTPLIAGKKGQMELREAYIRNREQGENGLYETLEYAIEHDMPFIGDVKFRKDAHKQEKSKSADIMNIHFLMGNIPTLVIILKYQDNRLFFNAAMWDEQAARPLIRPLFAMQHDPILAQEDENYCNEVIEKLHYTISIIIGAIRDQYAMITWGKQPTLSALLNGECNKRMKNFALNNSGMRNFLLQENEGIRKVLDAKEPALLQIYDQADINYMLRSLEEQAKMLNA